MLTSKSELQSAKRTGMVIYSKYKAYFTPWFWILKESILGPDFGSFWVPILDHFWIPIFDHFGIPILDQKNPGTNGD